MKKNKTVLKLGVITFIIFNTLFSIENGSASLLKGKGESALPILKINPSVRSSALSGSDATVLTGPQAAFLNPAGIFTEDGGFDLYSNYSKWIAGVNIGYLSTVLPAGKKASYAISTGYLIYPAMNQITADTRSSIGYKKGPSFNSYSGFGGITYSRKFSDKFFSGASLKYVTESIGSFTTGNTFLFDIGLIAKRNKYESYGLSLNNLSWGIKYEDDYERLPSSLRLGGSWSHQEYRNNVKGWKYTLSLGGEMRMGDGLYAQSGLEIVPVNIIKARVGYSYAVEADDLGGLGGLSAGLGLMLPVSKQLGINFEYAFINKGRLGSSHLIGLTFK